MTYQELEKLLTNKHAAAERLEKMSTDDLFKIISSRFDAPDVSKFIENILSTFGQSENALKKKRKLIIALLNTFRTHAEISSNQLNNILSSIVFNFTTFHPSDLKYFVDHCVDSIQGNKDKSTCWKDLLPTLLELMQDEKMIICDSASVNGQAYKSQIIKSICNEELDPKILTSLAKMFGEISMDKQELEIVKRILCSKIPLAELNELPALVHQMFKLNENDSKLFLITLSKYFANKYAEAEASNDENGYREIGKISTKEIQDVESTVLYYIYQSAKLNHQRLKDLIKFLRTNTAAPEFVIEPFIMSVLLLITDIHPEVLDILKAAVIRQVQDEVKRKHSFWLKNMSSQDWSIMEVVSKIVVNSDNKDRMMVLKGLLDFSFVLMSTQDKKIKDDIHLGEIGSKIVQKVLRKRHASCSLILQKLSLHISGHQISNKTQFTDCLSFVGHRMTLLLQDMENKTLIGDLLEKLPTMPGHVGIQTVNAVLPFISINSTTKDKFMLILRKCLYKKGTEARELAVIGFLELLKKVKLGSLNALSQSSSQSVASSSSVILTQATLEKNKSLSSNPRNNLALSAEIINILRRCFTHEAEVRMCLYKGLHEVVSENNNLAKYITTMLFDRLIKFYNPEEDIMPPINLDYCIVAQGTDMVIQEPIGDLIYSLQRIYIHTAANSSLQIDRLSIILESLCKRMAQLELEHLQMDDHIELLDDIPVAMRRIQGLKLCITVCEALIVYRIDSWSIESVDFAQSIGSLLKAYKRLTDCMKRIGKLPKGAKKKNKDKDKDKDETDTTVNKKARNNPLLQIAKVPVSVMEFKTIDRILKMLYLDSVAWTSEEQCENLKSRIDCHHYVLQTLQQLLQTTKKQKPIPTDIKKCIVSIGKLLYKKIVLNLEEINAFDSKTCILALECFKELCDLMCTCILKDLPFFLEEISGIQRCEGLDAQLRDVIPTMLQIVESNLDEDAENDIPVDSIPNIIMDTISHLLNKMPFDKGNNIVVLDCLYRLTVQKTNKGIACKLARMLLLVEETLNTKSDILREMCDSLLAENGYVDDTIENEVTVEHKFESINELSAKEMYEIVNNAVKEKLNNVDWYFSRLQAEQSLLVVDLLTERKHEELREKIRCICSQLIVITEMFEVITNTRQKTFFSDSILKNLQLFFKIVCKVTKYFYLTYNIDKEALTSSKFVSVIKRAGLEVTNNLYNFITFIETNQRISTSTDHSARFKDQTKVLRETKSIPKVIYELEQFRSEVISLEKKTNVPVGQYVRKVVNRGFKLLNKELDEGLNELDTSNLNTQNTTMEDSDMTTDVTADD